MDDDEIQLVHVTVSFYASISVFCTQIFAQRLIWNIAIPASNFLVKI